MAVNIGKTYDQGVQAGLEQMAKAAAPVVAKQQRDAEFWRKSWRWATWIVFANQMIILVLLAGILLR
jgi:hypothetical protein